MDASMVGGGGGSVQCQRLGSSTLATAMGSRWYPKAMGGLVVTASVGAVRGIEGCVGSLDDRNLMCNRLMARRRRARAYG